MTTRRQPTNRFNRIPALRTTAFLGMAFIVMLAAAGCPDTALLGTSNSANSANKPTITAPPDQTVECDGAGNQDELNAWLNSATTTPGCGDATLSNNFQALSNGCGSAGTATVTWTVTDACGNSASDTAKFTIADTTAPALTVPSPIAVTCGDPNAAAALIAWLAAATSSDICGNATITTQRFTMPGSCSAAIVWTAKDECGNPTSLSSTYTTNGDTTAPTLALVGGLALTIECGTDWLDPGTAIHDDCDALIQPTITGAFDLHAPGIYVLTYAAQDACGNTAPSLPRTITVVDTTPPVVTVKPPTVLWSPNHEMQPLTLNDLATVTDACEGPLNANDVGVILDIYSDEPDNTNGDGNTSGDIVITDDHSFSVRVERSGNDNGRVYGIHFRVTDASGNSVDATAFVQIPHDQSGSTAIDDGPSAGQVIVN